jgi:hypothetical protein
MFAHRQGGGEASARDELRDLRTEMRENFRDVRQDIREVRSQVATVKLFMLGGLVTVLATFIAFHG